MKLNELKPASNNKTRTRVGRGVGSGLENIWKRA